MTGEIDAVGGLATTGLAAQVLDTPLAGPASHGRCANCGAALDGNFCGQCGQKAHVHRSLLHVGEEFLHGITHFDGKAWQTLPMLLFRPGRLTRDYILGRRARYVAPVPLFLLVVFLMFFVFSFMNEGPGDASLNQMSVADARKELPRAEKSVTDIDKDIAAAKARSDAASVVTMTSVRNSLIKYRHGIAARSRGEKAAAINISDEITAAVRSSDVNLDLGVPGLDDKVRTALTNPELALYKVQGKAYKFSFLLVPLSLPWLWLLFFWKRGVRMYDHAVFALYSISFMSLVFTLVSLLLNWGVESGLVFFLLIAVVPPVHMYAQLKGAYALTTGGALWRTMVLAISALATLTVYAGLMLVLGVID